MRPLLVFPVVFVLFSGLPPRDGFTVAHFLTVADVERSAQFYENVFGGRIVRRSDRIGEPAYIQIANTWLIVNIGGGPTPDKPTVTLCDPDGYIIKVGQSKPGPF
jgi:catechol 2,3-dioxygenase-like lactoylglutathione lyase family enzyme